MDTKQIYIDKPCPEKWEDMIPHEQGRHCRKCCKTVVDFSNWKTEDIIGYISKSTQSVCGQVRAADVAVSRQPDDIRDNLLYQVFQAPVSFLKKVAAVIALCFGLAGSDNLLAQQKQKEPQKQAPQRPMILGGLRATQQKDTARTNNDPDMIRGDIAASPQQDTAKAGTPERPLKGKVRVNDPKKQ